MGSLQSQAKLIAIFELVISGCALVGLIAAGVSFFFNKNELAKDEAKLDKYPQLKEFVESSGMEQLMYFLMPGLYLLIEIILAAVLFIGSSENKQGLLKTWTTLTIVMGGIGLVFAGFGIVASKEKVLAIIFTVVGYAFTGYSLFVGYLLSNDTKIEVIS